MPGQKRMVLCVQVIGTGTGDDSNSDVGKGRPIIEASTSIKNSTNHHHQQQLGEYYEQQIDIFHKACKEQTWGRINSKLF